MAHLTLEDRIAIQTGLAMGKTLSEIARYIGKSRSTIAREIKKHRVEVKRSTYNDCIHLDRCDLPFTCPNDLCGQHRDGCKKCTYCNAFCEKYEPKRCERLDRSPYVCTSCKRANSCHIRKFGYNARKAQKAYEATLRSSRSGIALSDADLAALNSIFSGPLKQGQSVSAICAAHRGEINVCEKTIYKYVANNLFDADNFDLPRKVQRKPHRKKSGPILRVDHRCHEGRTYADYKSFLKEHPDVSVCQMDTVIGREGGKCLLTLYFKNCGLQLLFLRERNTAASVKVWFDWLRQTLGPEHFKELFQVILTDRGSEFTDPVSIECDQETGEQQLNLFYCDPQNSNQKAQCERNHELIRYSLPKGSSMDHLTQEDINELMSHINSYGRKKWNGQAPIDLFNQIYGQEVSNFLGLRKIPVDSINLRLLSGRE